METGLLWPWELFGGGPVCKQDKQITTIEARGRFVTREIGIGCGLIEYTKSYRSLCDSDNNDYAERTAALKAYRAYVAGKVVDRGAYATVEERKVKQYSKECQIPPAELPSWCRLWDMPTPLRCHMCNVSVAEGADYCKECKQQKIWCTPAKPAKSHA